jgi:hypothetical protein
MLLPTQINNAPAHNMGGIPSTIPSQGAYGIRRPAATFDDASAVLWRRQRRSGDAKTYNAVIDHLPSIDVTPDNGDVLIVFEPGMAHHTAAHGDTDLSSHGKTHFNANQNMYFQSPNAIHVPLSINYNTFSSQPQRPPSYH